MRAAARREWGGWVTGLRWTHLHRERGLARRDPWAETGGDEGCTLTFCYVWGPPLTKRSLWAGGDVYPNIFTRPASVHGLPPWKAWVTGTNEARDETRTASQEGHRFLAQTSLARGACALTTRRRVDRKGVGTNCSLNVIFLHVHSSGSLRAKGRS